MKNRHFLYFSFARIVVIILNNFHFDLSTVPKELESVKLNGTYGVLIKGAVSSYFSITFKY